MEYVREKATLHELAKTVKAWERKVEIAEVWLILSAAHQEYYHIHFSITDQIQIFDRGFLSFFPQMALRTHRQTWRKLCQQSGQSLRLPARTFDPMQSALYWYISDIVTHSVNYTINRHIKQVSIQIVGGSYDDTGVTTSLHCTIYSTRQQEQHDRITDLRGFFYSMLLVSGKLPEI